MREYEALPRARPRTGFKTIAGVGGGPPSCPVNRAKGADPSTRGSWALGKGERLGSSRAQAGEVPSLAAAK